MSTPQQQYQDALARLQQLSLKRQQYTQAMYDKMMDEQRRQSEEAAQARKVNPFAVVGKTLGGAAMGFIGSGFNPLGAAVGAGAGLVGGIVDENARSRGGSQPFAESSPLLMQAWMAQQRNNQIKDWMNSRTTSFKYPGTSETAGYGMSLQEPSALRYPSLTGSPSFVGGDMQYQLDHELLKRFGA
jgi:hypothetical protein